MFVCNRKYRFTRILYRCIDLQFFPITRRSNRTNFNRMEPLLGRGHLVNDESDLIDRYSPLSSTNNEDLEQDDDLFYTEEEHVPVEEKGVVLGSLGTDEDNESTSTLPTTSTTRSSSSIDEISGMGFGKPIDRFTSSRSTCLLLDQGAFKPPAFKMMSVESTPPPTPLIPRCLLDPMSTTTSAFQNMTLNNTLPMTPPRSADVNGSNWPLTNSTTDHRNTHSLFPRTTDTLSKPTTSLLTPPSMDRYLTGHRRLSDSAFTPSNGSFSFLGKLGIESNRLPSHLSRTRFATARYAFSWYGNDSDDGQTTFRSRST